jgi:hypothetical protein
MDHQIIELGFTTILTGVLATLGMTTFLYLSQAAGFANGDMVRAIGSAITRREENSLIPGLITHFFSGSYLLRYTYTCYQWFQKQNSWVLIGRRYSFSWAQ